MNHILLSYNPPAPQYGPPPNYSPNYGPPQYGPPAPHYGPPNHHYGPIHPEPVHGIPYSLIENLLDKFKFKLDLFTLGKILLKLVIFKKIVSLIAILCLLLFIPSLKHHEQDHEDEGGMDEMRKFGADGFNDRINSLAQFVATAIEGQKEKWNDEKCESLYCRGRQVLTEVDNKLPYGKLAKLYLKDA